MPRPLSLAPLCLIALAACSKKPDGNTFDGLVYLNGHWVLIPKPWRGLDTH